MTSSDWSTPLAGTNQTIGEAVLIGRGIPTDYFYVWIAMFVWGIGATVFNWGVTAWALTNLSGEPIAADALSGIAGTGRHGADVHSSASPGTLDPFNCARDTLQPSSRRRSCQRMSTRPGTHSS